MLFATQVAALAAVSATIAVTKSARSAVAIGDRLASTPITISVPSALGLPTINTLCER